MWDFEEMKSVGRKIDKGITSLEKKLENPSLIGYLDEDVEDKALAILDELLKEINTIDEQAAKYADEITEDIQGIKIDCDGIEKYIQEIQRNLEMVEDYGKEYGYAPPAHLINTAQSESSDLSQQFETSVLIENVTPAFQDSDIQSLRSVSPIPPEHGSSAVNETWESLLPTPNREMNATFTTPCSMYKVRALNLPEVSEVKDVTYNNLRVIPSSSPNFLKPRFILDETTSDKGTINSSSSSSSFAMNPRRLSRFPTNTSQLKTPPEPEISALSRRLFNRSAVKKRQQCAISTDGL